ncbi:ELP6 Elongator complex protein 6 [Candida maltosa Xu316]
MSNPDQDLIFFKDNSLISSKILNSSLSSLSTITYIPSVLPTWLITSLIENVITGKTNINKDYKNVIDDKCKITIISFLHDEKFYTNNLKKIGVNVNNSDRFKVVDYFSHLFTELIKDPTDATKKIEELFNLENVGDVVIVEGIEILLYGTNISSDELLFNITKLNRKCKQLFMVVGKSERGIDFDDFNGKYLETDPEFKITDFLVKLFHRSMLNVSLEPLTTGRAKDITGSLTVSKGAIDMDIEVSEKEYVYFISKDSQVKLYYR